MKRHYSSYAKLSILFIGFIFFGVFLSSTNSAGWPKIKSPIKVPNPIKIVTNPIKETFDKSVDVVTDAAEAVNNAAGEVDKKQKEIIRKAQEEVENVVEETRNIQKDVMKEVEKQFSEMDEMQQEILKDAQSVVSNTLIQTYEEQKKVLEELQKTAEKGAEDIAEKIEDCLKKLLAIISNGKKIIDLINKYGDHFPGDGPLNIVKDIEDPDLNILITDKIVNQNLKRFLESHPVFSLKDEDIIGNYVIIKDGIFQTDIERNVIKASITNASTRLDFIDGFLAVHPHVSNVTVEFSPKIIFEDNSWYIIINARLTYMNIDDFPNWGDKVVAGMANDGIQNPILKYDISEFITFESSVNLLGKNRQVKLNTEKAILKVEKDGLHLKVKLEKI